MILVTDVKDENAKCRACSNKNELIEIKVVDEKYNISDSIILCESCKFILSERLLPF